MSAGPGAVKKITQFSRQAHWLAERPNPEYSALFKWVMRWVPLAIHIYRAKLYWEKEREFEGFHIESGAEIRRGWSDSAAAYIRKNAPAKYREFLVPKTEIGCKRRVNDTDYLACLHRDNVELVYNDPVVEVTSSGVRTNSGRVIEADAIVLANGFETQKPFSPMEIVGEHGISITKHVCSIPYLSIAIDRFLTADSQWENFSEGSPSSYFGTCLSGFPNFFIMMGPNTVSGHLSVIYTTECQINFTLRVIKPVMRAIGAVGSLMPALGKAWDIVDLKPLAERRDIDIVQSKAKKLVWAIGCTSWFIDQSTNRNTIMFPDWQYKFWLRSVFITWSDFKYSASAVTSKEKRNGEQLKSIAMAILVGLVAGVGATLFLV